MNILEATPQGGHPINHSLSLPSMPVMDQAISLKTYRTIARTRTTLKNMTNNNGDNLKNKSALFYRQPDLTNKISVVLPTDVPNLKGYPKHYGQLRTVTDNDNMTNNDGQ